MGCGSLQGMDNQPRAAGLCDGMHEGEKQKKRKEKELMRALRYQTSGMPLRRMWIKSSEHTTAVKRVVAAV